MAPRSRKVLLNVPRGARIEQPVKLTDGILALARQLAWNYMRGVPYLEVIQELAAKVKLEADGKR